MKRCLVRSLAWTLSQVIFDLNRLTSELTKLEAQSSAQDFWNEPNEAHKVLKKASRLRAIVEQHNRLARSERDIKEIRELLESEPNSDLEKEADQMAVAFLSDLDAYELKTLLSGEHDPRSALVEISAGAGGNEACDWANMLFRMYSRWAALHNMKFEVMSETPGDVTGYRNVTFEISGDYAYGNLKAENGVHRLVRISPFDANARRHTSFCRIEVLPEFDESEVEIDPDDLKVETLRAGGAGGQHVNKTESAVRITHIPSGIVVQCQNERSQHKNRSHAMAVLVARLKELEDAKNEQRAREVKGEIGPAEWGRQIRSYVMQPYTMVKDHRTGHETGNVTGVLDGEIDGFIEAFLRKAPAEGTFIE